jgi:hypothetical protein
VPANWWWPIRAGATGVTPADFPNILSNLANKIVESRHEWRACDRFAAKTREWVCWRTGRAERRKEGRPSLDSHQPFSAMRYDRRHTWHRLVCACGNLAPHFGQRGSQNQVQASIR